MHDDDLPMLPEMNPDRARTAYERFRLSGRTTDLEEAHDALVELGLIRCEVMPDGEKVYFASEEIIGRMRAIMRDGGEFA